MTEVCQAVLEELSDSDDDHSGLTTEDEDFEDDVEASRMFGFPPPDYKNASFSKKYWLTMARALRNPNQKTRRTSAIFL